MNNDQERDKKENKMKEGTLSREGVNPSDYPSGDSPLRVGGADQNSGNENDEREAEPFTEKQTGA